MKIDIIGPYPPPYGGISLHISRMLTILKESGFEPKVYNQYSYQSHEDNIFATNKSKIWWLLYFFYKKPKVVHFHQFSNFHFPYVFLFSWFCKSKIFLTIHNQNLIACSPCKKKFYVFLLKYANNLTIISVSDSVQKLLLGEKIKEVIYLPAYVPPKYILKKSLTHNIGKKVIFNAWRIESYKDISKYGADFFFNLAKKYFTVSFFFFVGDSTSTFIKKYVDSLNLNNIYLIFGEPLVDYLENADIFLRLNREDAFGVSIQEALDLGVPVIASDVCKRPSGCILFKTSNFQDLDNQFFYALKEKREKLIIGRSKTTYHTELINLYKNCLGL